MVKTSHQKQKNERMAFFVECARQLIAEEGPSGISIRRIAERAGYHNSTIYFYFPDVEYLIALASVRAFEEYSRDLSQISSLEDGNPSVFYPVWESFCRAAFAQPLFFHAFFFGKYKDQLTDILNQYYLLFPEEKLEYTEIIQEMYYGRNLDERCLAILRPLADHPGTRVTHENMDMINRLTLLAFQDILDRKCACPDTESKELVEEFLCILHYLIDS